MSEPKLYKVHNDLIKIFMQYQYNLDYPMPRPYESQISISETISITPWEMKFNTDRIFANKVNALAAGVMHIVEPYIQDK